MANPIPNPTLSTTATLIEMVAGPSVLTRLPMDKLAEQPLLTPKTYFPHAPWVKAIHDEHGRRIPQTIGHRGYKAKFPENTMAAFEGAVEVGAHALETDIHLTKDGVVVLSHDATLKRCFGRDEKLIEYDWKEISDYETLAEPKQHMPRLQDLLEYLAKPGREYLWVLLDIKLDNDADKVMCLIGETIRSVAPSANRAWKDRVVLGVWAAKYLTLCHKYLPDFPISYIGHGTTYAQLFFAVPNICFNLLQANLMGWLGARFLRKAKKYDREVIGWTVNDEKRMRWCIRKQLDGVITDDPKMFLDVCKNYAWNGQKEKFTWREMYPILRVQFFTNLWALLFRLRYGYRVDKRFIGRPRMEVQQ